MRGKRRRLATGIYADGSGYAVVWPFAGRPKEKRFPSDTPLAALKQFRRQQVARAPIDAPPRDEPRGSFTRDVVRFLNGRRGRAGFKADRAHLRPWVRRFGAGSRFAITREAIQFAIAQWQQDGYSPQELRHRWRILRAVFAALDPDFPNPCDRVALPRVPKPQPRGVSDTLVRDIALRLYKQEFDGIRRLRDAKTRARFLVLATTGMRPAQVRRAQPADVDLERRIWYVSPAKGGLGTTIYLNEDMCAAWALFVVAHAWGHYDQRSFVKTLQRNGWPKGIRPYALRHTVGLTLSELGVDLGDIQAHLGHASPTTTRVYVPGLLDRLKLAMAKIDNRLVNMALVPRSVGAGLSNPVQTRANREGEKRR